MAHADSNELLAAALAQLGREQNTFTGPLPPIPTADDPYVLEEHPMNMSDQYEIYVDHEDGQRIKSRPIEKKEEIALKGRYTVKYKDIFVYNIAATQELDRQLQDQMGKNNALHQDMEEYKQTMDDKMDMVLNQMSALMEENNALKLRIKWLEEK